MTANAILSFEAAPKNVLSPAQMDIAIAMLGFVKSQLPDLSSYIESQAMIIVEEFKALSEQTMRHSEQLSEVVHIASELELNGEKVPFERSVDILYEPLSHAIEKILEVSKLSMSMVMNIGNAADNIGRMEYCIEQVQMLTKQTNMLAMNTQIEAARTGETGKAFRIIAQEVKALSERIKSVSSEIYVEVRDVSGSVRRSADLVDSLANYDMTENMQLRSKIDELIRSIMTQNEKFSQLLRDASAASAKTAHTINNLVVGIQFQDRSSQITGDLVTLMDESIAMLEQQRDAMAEQVLEQSEILESQIERSLDGIKLSEIRHQSIRYFAKTNLLSLDSALYLSTINHKENTPAKAQNDAEDDDIELF